MYTKAKILCIKWWKIIQQNVLWNSVCAREYETHYITITESHQFSHYTLAVWTISMMQRKVLLMIIEFYDGNKIAEKEKNVIWS